MPTALIILLTALVSTALSLAVAAWWHRRRLREAPLLPTEPTEKAVPESLPPIPPAIKNKDDAAAKSREILLGAMQRTAATVATASSSELIPLPSEDLKGRLIGREGRNIRAFEQVTGVDLIVDDAPNAVLISSFDLQRREVAKRTLLKLLQEGKIQPARIEDLHAQSRQEVEHELVEDARRAAIEAGGGTLPAKVLEAVGRLKYRTSYSQNVLSHSVEVAQIAGFIAAELGLNVETARRAGLLHDIGKSLGPEWDGPHALAGMRFLKSAGEREPVLHAVGAHHFEIEPNTPEAIVLIVADQISAARPGARLENPESFIQRVAALESIASEFAGVEGAFAVQAGRELRVLVKPEQIDDQAAASLAKDIARRIEAELPKGGQVKVTVIRETRIHEIAKPS